MPSDKLILLSELESKKSPEAYWVAIEGNVYDVVSSLSPLSFILVIIYSISVNTPFFIVFAHNIIFLQTEFVYV